MKTCFVVCPIGADNSPQRKRSDTVLKHIIEPVCKELEFEVIRVDQIHGVDKIDTTIINHLETAELVIADMTEHNPNAFYEIGFRHALNKPLIPIKDEDTSIPFDLANVRTITYATNDLEKAENAKNRLRETILSFGIQEESPQDNDDLKYDTQNHNIVPYLLNIQDSIAELKDVVKLRNNEMLEQTVELAIAQIQKNSSSSPEDKFLQMFMSKALEQPDKIEGFMKVAEKFK
ncbi:MULTISPECIES: hypothetical protein [Lysinibacillus]|uniref:hypothetical protein n=1 Tax=Lysinibacillus TaxID=400634 RepID=UPI00257F2872|nr:MULTISPECIES: hypothetical protein [Lysinibacillus]